MWDIDYIQRMSGASNVEQLGSNAIACTPPEGGDSIVVRAERVPGRAGGVWLVKQDGEVLCNPCRSISEAVSMIGNWHRIWR